MEIKQYLDIIYKKNENPLIRINTALKCLEEKILSSDIILKWISKTISFDSEFCILNESWDLFLLSINNSFINSEKFSIKFNNSILFLTYKSNASLNCITCLKYLIEIFPNAWRPKFE